MQKIKAIIKEFVEEEYEIMGIRCFSSGKTYVNIRMKVSECLDRVAALKIDNLEDNKITMFLLDKIWNLEKIDNLEKSAGVVWEVR